MQPRAGLVLRLPLPVRAHPHMNAVAVPTMRSPADRGASTAGRQPTPGASRPVEMRLDRLYASPEGRPQPGEERCARDEVVETSQPEEDDGMPGERQEGQAAAALSVPFPGGATDDNTPHAEAGVGARGRGGGAGGGIARGPAQLLSAQRAFIAKLPAVSRRVDSAALRGSGLAGQLKRAAHTQQAERARWERRPEPGACLEVTLSSREMEAHLVKCTVAAARLPASFPPTTTPEMVRPRPIPPAHTSAT